PKIVSVKVAGHQLAPGPDEDTDDYEHDFFYRAAGTARFAAFDGAFYADEQSALAHGRSSTFQISAAGPVGFALRHGPGLFDDNRGGLSLRITAVPEPGTFILAALALVALVNQRKLRRSARQFPSI